LQGKGKKKKNIFKIVKPRLRRKRGKGNASEEKEVLLGLLFQPDTKLSAQERGE